MEVILSDISTAVNEPIKNYGIGSNERASLKAKLNEMESEIMIRFGEIPEE